MMERSTSGGAAAVFLWTATLAAVLGHAVEAQQKGGGLAGRLEVEGEIIPGILVTVTPKAEGSSRTTVSNENGEYRFDFLPPGSYEVTFQLEGLDTLLAKVEVEAGRVAEVDRTMELAPVREDVIVMGKVAEVSEAGAARGSAAQRLEGDGSLSLGFGYDGAPIDSLEIGLKPKQLKKLDPSWVSEETWKYDSAAGIASGPPVKSLRIRFAAPGRFVVPSLVELRALLDEQLIFEDQVKVEQRPAVDPSAPPPDVSMPSVVSPGRWVYFRSEADDFIHMEYKPNAIYPAWPLETFGAGAGRELEDEFELDWAFYERRINNATSIKVGRVQVPVGVFGEGGDVGNLLSFYATLTPVWEPYPTVQVIGEDEYGETTFTLPWEPIVVPPGLFGDQPVITAASDLTFAGQTMCVCGSFDNPGALGQLQIGGRSLGTPIGASSYVATFTTPGDLAPGAYEVGWAPGFGGRGGPVVTEVIEIRAGINDEVIRAGGTTGLEMRIVGTEKPVHIGLFNRSPDLIRMSPSDTIETDSTGGAKNHVPNVKVKARKAGDYSIDWVVDAGECPCEETLPRVADRVREELQRLYDPETLKAGGLTAQWGADWIDPERAEEGCDLSPSQRSQPLRVVPGSDGDPDTSADPNRLGCGLLDPRTAAFARKPGAPDVVITTVDGCAINDHLWVVARAVSDGEYSLTVKDSSSGESRSYGVSLGRGADVMIDTAAFATCR